MVHHATTETPARVAVRDGEAIELGRCGRVQLRLQRPIAAVAGDRVVIRQTAPQTTVAGGVVIDSAPSRSGREPELPQPAAAPVTRVLSDAGADQLERRLAETPQLRDGLGCSRRYAQALLEALDSHGVTRRVGDARVLRRSHRNPTG